MVGGHRSFSLELSEEYLLRPAIRWHFYALQISSCFRLVDATFSLHLQSHA